MCDVELSPVPHYIKGKMQIGKHAMNRRRKPTSTHQKGKKKKLAKFQSQPMQSQTSHPNQSRPESPLMEKGRQRGAAILEERMAVAIAIQETVEVEVGDGKAPRTGRYRNPLSQRSTLRSWRSQ